MEKCLCKKEYEVANNVFKDEQKRELGWNKGEDTRSFYVQYCKPSLLSLLKQFHLIITNCIFDFRVLGPPRQNQGLVVG